MSRSHLVLSAAVLLALPFAARAQNASLPSAPAPKPVLVLPPGTVIASPQTPAPPAPEEDTYCYGAATGVYAKKNTQVPDELKSRMRSYTDNIYYQIGDVWRKHMPREVNDPWVKGKKVVIRFAIRPDGSYLDPIVTLSSGRSSYDKHALDAVYTFSTFQPLPEGLNHPLPVCFTFGYNLGSGPSAAQPFDAWPGKAKPAPAIPATKP